MKKLLAAGFVGLALQASHASSWHFIAANNDGGYYFIDSESIKVTRSSVDVWIQDFLVDEEKSITKESSKALFRFDCEARTAQQMSRTKYTAEKKLISTNSIPTLPTNNPPDTVGDALLMVACKRDFSKSTPIDSPQEFAENYKKLAKLISDWTKSSSQKEPAK